MSKQWIREIDIVLHAEGDDVDDTYRPAQVLRLMPGKYGVKLLSRGVGRDSVFNIPQHSEMKWSNRIEVHLHWSDGRGHHYFSQGKLGQDRLFAEPKDAFRAFNDPNNPQEFWISYPETVVVFYAFIDRRENYGGAKLHIEKLD